jgi:hypothetical protein
MYVHGYEIGKGGMSIRLPLAKFFDQLLVKKIGHFGGKQYYEYFFCTSESKSPIFSKNFCKNIPKIITSTPVEKVDGRVDFGESGPLQLREDAPTKSATFHRVRGAARETIRQNFTSVGVTWEIYWIVPTMGGTMYISTYNMYVHSFVTFIYIE